MLFFLLFGTFRLLIRSYKTWPTGDGKLEILRVKFLTWALLKLNQVDKCLVFGAIWCSTRRWVFRIICQSAKGSVLSLWVLYYGNVCKSALLSGESFLKCSTYNFPSFFNCSLIFVALMSCISCGGILSMISYPTPLPNSTLHISGTIITLTFGFEE